MCNEIELPAAIGLIFLPHEQLLFAPRATHLFTPLAMTHLFTPPAAPAVLDDPVGFLAKPAVL